MMICDELNFTSHLILSIVNNSRIEKNEISNQNSEFEHHIMSPGRFNLI